MKQVTGMKKYSSLFLFVVLLNATSHAQPINQLNRPATATQSLSGAAVTALQGFGRAVVAILSPVVMIEDSPTPAPGPALPAKVVVAPAQPAPQVIANDGGVRIPETLVSGAETLISGRGVRTDSFRSLKGQTTGDLRLDGLIIEAASYHGVEPLLLYSVMSQESAFERGAISNKGASGLMQLMPATAARFGVTNIFDPKQNIYAGARYLRLLLDMFDGDVNLALAGYNAGEGAVKRYGYNVPPYPETINYVRKIRRRYHSLSGLSE